ncbi:MAG: polyphosphate kinase 2 family protein [Planctomycetota bacterium]
MYEATPSPYLVPFDGSFRVAEAPTVPPKEGVLDPHDDDHRHAGKHDAVAGLEREIKKLRKLQRVLYARDRHSILCVFQAMDAAGKDGTIRAVLSGVDPAGCQVHSFKRPTEEELDHDFLWRTSKALPERGRIGIFNRSYYEEVLVVKVHPELLAGQRIPHLPHAAEVWRGRYASIRQHEEHLARNGVVILKFWLNVSKDEQARRFLDRLEEPEKQWKFAAGDLRERARWDDYMEAYESALRETSRPWAPWYAIPADDKHFMRWQVARTLRKTLQGLSLAYPEPDPAEVAEYHTFRKQLRAELELE